MDAISLGSVIASRTLRLGTQVDGVTVSIGAPKPYADGKDFYCPFRIEGLGDDRVKYAGGVDAVQALQLAMQRIGIELYASPHASALRWIDPDGPDLGFPVPENLRDMIPQRPHK